MSSENSSTGVVMPWEKLAQRGEPMPDGLDYPEQVLFQALSLLYARYWLKSISRDEASKEKAKLLDEYRIYKHHWEMGAQWCEVIKATELARAEFRRNPSVENGTNLVLIIEGRKLNELPPPM